MSARHTIDIRDVLPDPPGAFAQAMRASAGFSLRYDGMTVGPQFSRDWRQSGTEDRALQTRSTKLSHATGLVMTRELRVLADFGAIEYQIHFRNAAHEPLSPVSAFHALDLAFDAPVLNGTSVISSGGGLADGFLPPRSFALREQRLAPTVPGMGMVCLAAEGGRSSNKDLPFFFLHNEVLHEGLFVAFGWSGQWEALVHLDPASDTLSLRGKIPGLELALEAGEEICGPTVLVGFYQGALADGSCRLRRLLRDVYTPKLAGERFLPVSLFSAWWHVEENFDESLMKRMVDGAAAIDQEYYEIDAAWYAGASKEAGFSAGLGNWEEVDRKKLPNGLKPVADYARFRGLKFGLWFEPERVAMGSRIAREHPEWILWKPAGEPESSEMGWLRDIHPDLGYFKHNYGLLDYGRPDVQEWVCAMLDRSIREYGVQYIRYDFNLDPLPYWSAHDQPRRRGLTQLRHIQGFYAVIDQLRARNPEVILEACASGGRRIDLETARRFHTFFISDATVDPAIVRFHLFGINHFLPGNYHGVAYILPHPHQKDFQADHMGFQSFFGGAFGAGGRVDLWPQACQEQARRHMAVYKQLRRYLIEDYYPLTPQPADLTSWSGWQFHDPIEQSGFVQTFRTNTPRSTNRFVLHKLDAQARYRLADAYESKSFEIAGSTAMSEGIEVTQVPMSSRVFLYQRIA
jgi:alpha-galactosidase